MVAEGDVAQDPNRRANRIEISRRALIRGVCGDFYATAEDLSLTGVRVRVPRSELRIAEGADLATAAAIVQTRIGSRCVIELGLRQMSRGVARKVEIVRLVLPTGCPDSLDLGCQFEEALTDEECRALRVELPDEETEATVRSSLSWEDESRPPLDPALTVDKVDALFDVETTHKPGPSERIPRRTLRVVLTAAVEGRAAAPLTCTAESLSVSTILLRIAADHAETWLAGRRDLSEVAQVVELDYGSWPDLEITDGARRLWRGGARVFGLEMGDAGDQDIFLRLVFSRRLREQELERICRAA
ncbi:MAG: hypothetical protein QNJ90_05765 [Planctomycetota bacterium]|nr:hypothetical protein [Planctomycetota bacterium]